MAGPPGSKAVRRELEHLLASPDFDASPRSRDFLQYIVQEALAGRGDDLTQAAIATRVFGRKDDFDALLDPIVRIQAGRLRRSLERYYLLGGKQDPVRIELPRGTYAPAFRAATPESEAAAAAAPPEPVPVMVEDSWPSVAVSLFEASSDSEHQELAVRLTEELATELGRYRDARVVLQRDADRLESSRRAQQRFELRGRLLRDGTGWLVTVRLVDRATAVQLWGEQYLASSEAEKVGGALDHVAHVIAARVGAEHGLIVQTLAREYRTRPSAAAGAYGAILRSYDFFFVRDLDDLAPAVEALQRVVVEEPELPLAWTQLARLYQVNYAFELSDLQTPIDESISFAYRAVQLDPSSARARCILAASLLIKGELQAGQEELEQALRLNPGSLVYLEIIGYEMALLGDWERGIQLVRDAMDRNPHHMPHALFGLWADYLRRGAIEEAYSAALRYRDATFFWRSLMRACCLGHLGRSSEARVELAELLKQKPSFPERGRILVGTYIKPLELQERVFEGLRKAGLPG